MLKYLAIAAAGFIGFFALRRRSGPPTVLADYEWIGAILEPLKKEPAMGDHIVMAVIEKSKVDAIYTKWAAKMPDNKTPDPKNPADMEVFVMMLKDMEAAKSESTTAEAKVLGFMTDTYANRKVDYAVCQITAIIKAGAGSSPDVGDYVAFV